MLNDVDPTSLYYNSTFGSGGGFLGAGLGGGRIILKATGTAVVHQQGRLIADGSAASTVQLGAGSGGSITISAAQCTQDGFISARGGSSNALFLTAGGAGGGGRVAIIVSIRILALSHFLIIAKL